MMKLTWPNVRRALENLDGTLGDGVSVRRGRPSDGIGESYFYGLSRAFRTLETRGSLGPVHVLRNIGVFAPSTSVMAPVETMLRAQSDAAVWGLLVVNAHGDDWGDLESLSLTMKRASFGDFYDFSPRTIKLAQVFMDSVSQANGAAERGFEITHSLA